MLKQQVPAHSPITVSGLAAGLGAVIIGEDRSSRLQLARKVQRHFAARDILMVDSGTSALHRVTTVEGDRLRLVPVLSFSARPDDSNSPEVRELFWGRSGPPGESA